MEKKLRISLITGFFLFGIFSGYASAGILPTTSGTGIDHCLPFLIEYFGFSGSISFCCYCCCCWTFVDFGIPIRTIQFILLSFCVLLNCFHFVKRLLFVDRGQSAQCAKIETGSSETAAVLDRRTPYGS